ncbi:MAG: hypothetical protein HOO96_41185 [Polyangiaceae bacterium]|nr:hypothetical protein [Polyangiaceae bacterium]
MSKRSLPQIAVLAALTGAPHGLRPATLLQSLAEVDVDADQALVAVDALVAGGEVSVQGSVLVLSQRGARALLDVHAQIERAMDPSPSTPGMEECPSIPWLTTVQTHWLDAVSLNYAVDPAALAPLLPKPLEPEIHEGCAWVQVLASRLRDMRPQGMPALFGVNFHQVSYRAAVHYRAGHGTRRGGYFLRSETDNAVMRAVGNALVEFRFHDFEAAKVSLERRADLLELRVDPEGTSDVGRVAADLRVDDRREPPASSRWKSRETMQRALVDCFDAFGVDPAGWVYVLTIDRDPWRAVFATPTRVEVAWMDQGPLRGAVLDSALHIPSPCGYRWRPLRRERFLP